MRRFMPLIVLLLIAGGAFFYFFMWEDTKWPKAKTSLEAIDNFNKAVKNRDYKHAAKYCSKQYAELLTKAAPQRVVHATTSSGTGSIQEPCGCAVATA